ncbi:MAG: hypothetical protein V5A43_05525 [Haloarculaceae archaeon]
MAGYYDIVLGLIPLALGGISGVLVAAGFPLTTAIPVASGVSAGLIGHAMFLRPPVTATHTRGAGETGGVASPTE